MYYGVRFARVERVGSPDKDGWVKVSMRFDVEEVACEYVLSFGTRMEVLEPEALRDMVINSAKGIIEFYDQKSNVFGRGTM
jgi:predicted DNA-binding transcriptional regulator YafY